MKNNPFSKEQTKNYILFYIGVVVIVVLFFIATTLFHDVKDVKPKHFDINQTKIEKAKKSKEEKAEKKKNNTNFEIMSTEFK